MPGSGINTIIVSNNPDSKDITKDQTPEAIDKAMDQIIKDAPKQPK